MMALSRYTDHTSQRPPCRTRTQTCRTPAQRSFCPIWVSPGKGTTEETSGGGSSHAHTHDRPPAGATTLERGPSSAYLLGTVLPVRALVPGKGEDTAFAARSMLPSCGRSRKCACSAALRGAKN